MQLVEQRIYSNGILGLKCTRRIKQMCNDGVSSSSAGYSGFRVQCESGSGPGDARLRLHTVGTVTITTFCQFASLRLLSSSVATENIVCSRFTFHASSWIWFFTEFSNMSQHMSGDLKRYSAGNTRKVSTNNSLELVRPQLGNKTTDHRTHLNSNSTLNQTDATVATKC